MCCGFQFSKKDDSPLWLENRVGFTALPEASGFAYSTLFCESVGQQGSYAVGTHRVSALPTRVSTLRPCSIRADSTWSHGLSPSRRKGLDHAALTVVRRAFEALGTPPSPMVLEVPVPHGSRSVELPLLAARLPRLDHEFSDQVWRAVTEHVRTNEPE
jgi:hypothetical protein